jgi:hypothetical protein
MPVASVGHTQQALSTARPLNPTILVFHPEEKQLIAQPERQMFQEGWVQMSPQPSVQATSRRMLDVRACSMPAAGKLGRYFGHWNVMHLRSSSCWRNKFWLIL